MKHLKLFENFIFESNALSVANIRKEISNVLSRLVGFDIKTKIQYPKGPIKRISHILDIANRIQVIITKDNKSSFEYSEIEYRIKNLIGYLSSRYTIIGKSAGTSYSQVTSDVTKGKYQSFTFTFKLNEGILPSQKKVSNTDHISEVFQELIDLGVDLSIKDLEKYTKIIIKNLKPRKTPSTLGGPNEWIPLTNNEISELKDSIDRYIGIYDVSFFDSEIIYRGKESPIYGNTRESIREKVIKTHDELFTFLDNNDILGISLIFKNDE